MELEGISKIYLRFFKIKPFDLANSILNMFAFHCNKTIPKSYTKSEFTVRYIHFLVSRADSSFKVRLNWLMSARKLTYKLLLYILKLFPVRIFSYYKNNSTYCLIYNAGKYEKYFEEDFIILNEFANS